MQKDILGKWKKIKRNLKPLSSTLAISLWSLVAYCEALVVSDYLFYSRYF